MGRIRILGQGFFVYKVRNDVKARRDMEKLSIGIIFGGASSEYGVSLQSASAVIRNLNKDRYQPVLIGISQQGQWFYYEGDIEHILADTWCKPTYCKSALISPDKRERALIVLEERTYKKIHLDAVFPILHGKNGEDGTVQGMVELAGIPLVGCKTLSSALCMDKDRAHKLARMAGVEVPQALVINSPLETVYAKQFGECIGYPLFVKPVKAGSSYGVAKVTKEADLIPSILEAFRYDNQVIIEENIDGFEVGCAIIGKDELVVGEVDEIELSGGFFDFTEKYTLKTSAIHVPARISKETAESIKETAKKIYRALDCSGFARVDMFWATDGRIIFNEVNTIPGFTEHSRYPGMLKAAGISFTQLLDTLIKQAVSECQ